MVQLVQLILLDWMGIEALTENMLAVFINKHMKMYVICEIISCADIEFHTFCIGK